VKEGEVNEGKVEKMLREIGTLMSWQIVGHMFLQMGCIKAYGEVTKVALSFIKSYGSKQDWELFRKIGPLVDAEIAKWKEEEKKGVSISLQADEATKRWVAGLLKDIGRHLEK